MENGGRIVREPQWDDGFTRRKVASMALALVGASGSTMPGFGACADVSRTDQNHSRSDETSIGTAVFGQVRWEKKDVFPIAVQVVGGLLPAWVDPSDPVTPSALEFVFVRAGLPISDRAKVAPLNRIIFIDEKIMAAASPDVAFTVSGAASELDIIAEAFVRTIIGPTIIGVDFADTVECASFRLGVRCERARLQGQGHAIVVLGTCTDRSSSAAALAAVQKLERLGFGGGLFVSVLINRERAADSRAVWDTCLYDLDLFLQPLYPREADRPFVINANPGASRDAIVIVAFDALSSYANPLAF